MDILLVIAIVVILLAPFLAVIPAFLIFIVSMVAEAGRPPFDLAEAEGELVAGFHTEYSGMRFGMFMLAEFMNVVTMSAIMVTLFFGGPSGPTFGLPSWIAWVLPIVWFLLKMFAFIFFFVLLRAALPRMRYDKLMDLGWKVLIPVGLVWVLVTAAMVVANDLLADDARFVIAGVGILLAGGLYLAAPLFSREKVGAAALVAEPGRTPAEAAREEVGA